MSQPVELHVVLIDVGTYDFLSICHNSSNSDAKVLLFFDMSDHKIVGGCKNQSLWMTYFPKSPSP